MQVLVRNRLETSLFAGVKEAGWTPEDQRKRDSFVLLVGNARLPNSPESRLKFMEQALFRTQMAWQSTLRGGSCNRLCIRNLISTPFLHWHLRRGCGGQGTCPCNLIEPWPLP